MAGKSSLPLLLIAGGAAVLVATKSKKKKTHKAAGADALDPNSAEQKVLPELAGDEVGFSADYSNYHVGATWTLRHLEIFLNERRLAGTLLTKVEPGLLYQYLVDNPATFLGDLFGASKNTGLWLYGTLWAVATFGATAHAFGFAGAAARSVAGIGINARALPAAIGANQAAAVQVAATKIPRFQQWMANMRNTRAGLAAAKRQGFKASAKMMSASGALGGASAANSLGIGRVAMTISQNAAKLGTGVALTALANDSIPEGYSDDLAASALEAQMEFADAYTVKVGAAGIPYPISSLPGTDENPAVQAFNKLIMSHIIKFQMSSYENS